MPRNLYYGVCLAPMLLEYGAKIILPFDMTKPPSMWIATSAAFASMLATTCVLPILIGEGAWQTVPESAG